MLAHPGTQLTGTDADGAEVIAVATPDALGGWRVECLETGAQERVGGKALAIRAMQDLGCVEIFEDSRRRVLCDVRRPTPAQ